MSTPLQVGDIVRRVEDRSDTGTVTSIYGGQVTVLMDTKIMVDPPVYEFLEHELERVSRGSY